MGEILDRNIQSAIATLEQVARLDSQISAAASVISEALLSGHKLLACGNGGSAADASHLTTEFVSRFKEERRPYPAISLSTHGGDLTGIGNDYSFNDIFSRQIQAFGVEGDVLVAFTTSGNSENVYRALAKARELDVKTISFLGRDGGKCAGLADIELLVCAEATARMQEAHKFMLHTICEMVEMQLR